MKCNGHFTILVIDIWGAHSGESNKLGAILSVLMHMCGFTNHNNITKGQNKQVQGKI